MRSNRLQLAYDWLRKLPTYLRLVLDCFAAVVPWSFVVSAPGFYSMGYAVALGIGYYFGVWIALAYTTAITIPIATVVYLKIKHEEQTQLSKYVDRWEGTEKQQEQALEFLLQASKKKKE